MEDRSVVSRKEPTPQETTAVEAGSMARQNTNRDNDATDARRSNDTSERMHGNDNAADETTKAMEIAEPIHSRTIIQEKERIKARKDRNNAVRIQTSRNAGRNGTEPR